ncbi:mechanosensitive ion channel family protein [Dysgonomonas sp. 511]|uniref:mechanosensitive ion channel family protein n=1 Tax=Dysgonomonas sp. 511 TaxID=2302930 RepID=UPI0013D74802|nr:mechanosensitive ion channel domain-containing protein [Dysgonomonas sp. 511]NDV78548.1 mechanosensitive ion channel protein MscS [Dysgonomonas sp. 511]
MDTQTEINTLTVEVAKWIRNILQGMGVPEEGVEYTYLIILLVLVVAIAYALQYISKYLLRLSFKHLHKITRLSFFKHALNNKLAHYVAMIVPYSFVMGAIPVVFYDFKAVVSPAIKITEIYMVFMVIWIFMAIIKTFANILEEKPAFSGKPMKSYIQVINIVCIIFGAVVIYSILTGKSATAFFAAMGAASAIVMLVFQDSIKGFVGSIQVTANNMVQIGDWITMPKYGADGDVMEINLTTVKVRNFDKTITTLPTYSLISDSFQNWRGMKEAGGRRFKRSLNIKHDTIRFLTGEELEKYKEIDGLKDYITAKQQEYADWNKNVNNESPFNVHSITNCDLYLQYGIYYLRNHPQINKELTLLVRQLAPTSQGLPIELYTFTNTTVWAEYEVILSEIINHFISIVKYFDLKIYEESSGSDIYDVYMKERKYLEDKN